MTRHDIDDTAVLNALRDSLDGVTMSIAAADIVSAGRSRIRRRRMAQSITGALTVAALALTVTPLGHSSGGTPPPATGTSHAQVRALAFTLARHADGTVQVTWDKQRYFEDPAGLEQALRQAGFPVMIKVGEFCAGRGDDTSLDPSGSGPGVDQVIRARRQDDDSVTFVFSPAAMPAGKQLFIGYLSAAQLAITHGAPGSVERLITAEGPLTCTTQAPPKHIRPGTPEAVTKKD